MELKLKEFRVDDSPAYKITRARFCCDAIKKCAFVDLGQDLEFVPQVAISQEFVVYADGVDWQEIVYTKINFCPFCGEKITLDVEEIEDVSEYYGLLQKKGREYRHKSKVVDSKKEENELLEKARMHSDELNYYLTNDSIHSLIL